MWKMYSTVSFLQNFRPYGILFSNHRYVLLKELNKLMTMHHEAERVHIFMPGGERIGKVNNNVKLQS